MELTFKSGARQLAELTGRVVVITGAARSGKTTVGNILGTCRGVEHLDDPWLLMMLPLLAGRGVLPRPLALDMFRTCAAELMHDRVLMRHVNFRPEDLSSIWKQKEPGEIFARLVGMSSREDVRSYSEQACPTLALTLANTVPFYDFFWEAVPGCQVVHMVRDGLDVAIDVVGKGWLSDNELLAPAHPDPYRRYIRIPDGVACYLPHWVEEGSEERYVQSSEFARSLQYWRRLMELSGVTCGGKDGQTDPHLVRFSDVLENPASAIGSLVDFLEMERSALTGAQIAKVRPPAETPPPADFQDAAEREELAAVKEISVKLGLPIGRIDRLLSCYSA